MREYAAHAVFAKLDVRPVIGPIRLDQWSSKQTALGNGPIQSDYPLGRMV
jgi:hypothetical protein